VYDIDKSYTVAFLIAAIGCMIAAILISLIKAEVK